MINLIHVLILTASTMQGEIVIKSYDLGNDHQSYLNAVHDCQHDENMYRSSERMRLGFNKTHFECMGK